MPISRHFVAACAAVAFTGTIASASSKDVLVEKPQLDLPKRGSIAGSLADFAVGAAELARGVYSLPLPLAIPSDRGPLLANVIPTYSAEGGISEWGMGLQTNLSIRRHRIAAEIDFSAYDDFVGPWGRLAKGDDGSYYPIGLGAMVRLTFDGASWTAVTPDGTRYRFDAADAVTTPLGTYEWMLSRVDTLVADSTTLIWTRNASGRAFLAEARWGGRGDGTQYRMRFVYETLARTFDSYVSGQQLVLDRRISRVVLDTLSSGVYVERWRYDVTYTASPTGPAFYLASLRRTYRSGAVEPAVTYDYDLGAEQLATAVFEESAKLTALLAQYGETAAEPDRAGMTDLEQNGLTDLEVHGRYDADPDQTKVTQTEAGFLFEQLPHVAGEHPLCRPPPTVGSTPRHLARMDAVTAEPHVVVTIDESISNQTRIMICDYYGRALVNLMQAGVWNLDANTRLVDINLDQKPDIVRVRNGSVRVLKNVTLVDPLTGTSYFAFTQLAAQTLTVDGVTTVTPLASWVLDFNGDGRADIMVRHAGGVVVWRGVGGNRFESIGTSYPFQLLGDGGTLNPAGYEFSHGDFNNDGLADVILSNGTQVLLFTNQGRSFVQVAVPGLGSISATGGYPVIADLSGSGNEQVVLPSAGRGYALQLTTPSTGLLRATDDGKGTVVAFGYDRVKPVSGMRHRYSILGAMTTASSGYDAVSSGYQYDAPVWHTLGKYLVGFSAVTKSSPFLVETVGFHNDDDVSGVIVSEQDIDARSPDVVRFRTRTLLPTTFHGVPWRKLVTETSGFRNSAGTRQVSTRADFLVYQRVCPIVVERHTPHGTLREETTFTTAAQLDPELSCLSSTTRQIGTHPDQTLDFDYRLQIDRDSMGRLTKAWQLGPLGSRLLQQVTYNAKGRIASVAAPGEGSWSYTYDATTGQVATITSPEGVVQTVMVRDPITDATQRWRINRGAATGTTNYAFDDQERLQKTWDSVAGTTAVRPSSELAYTYATSTTPARILEKRLVDLTTGAMAEQADLLAADGASIAMASRTPTGWAFGELARTQRSTLTERRYVRDPLSSIEGVTHAALDAGAILLGEAVATGGGQPLTSTQTIQTDVTQQLSSRRAIVGGELVTTIVENGAQTTRTGAGDDGKVRWFEDERGIVTDYEYDTLGRVRRVHTPSGDQRLDYDAYGQPSIAEREGIARIQWSYDNTTGHLTERRDIDADGQVDRFTAFFRDALGRPETVIETKPATGASRVIKRTWDGKNLAGDVAYTGQRGFETMTSTGPLTKIMQFRADGKPASMRWTFDNWRAIEQTFDYVSGGQTRHVTTTIEDLDPQTPATGIIRTVQTDYGYDLQGRLATYRVNGVTVYTVIYDNLGRLAEVRFGNGGTLALSFDATTRDQKGWTVTGTAPTGSLTWRKNARGLVASETFGVATSQRRRNYAYDVRGYLKSTSDQVKSGTTWTAAGAASYDYDEAGLITFASDPFGGGEILRTENEITRDGESYGVDAMGRVVSHDDLEVEYGPSGMIERATRGAMSFEYSYDERGERVLKRSNGVPAAAYINAAYLTASRLIEPLEVGGVTIGVLDNGAFVRLPFDARGSRIATNGALDVPQAYGARASNASDPVIAAAIDYARNRYDADLGLVRMGIRDYDPGLGQFWTPDQLFLTSIEKCVESPAECNLYGYAKNDPVSFVDRTGTDGHYFRRWEGMPKQCTENDGARPDPSELLNRGSRRLETYRELEMSLRRIATASSAEFKDGKLEVTLPHRAMVLRQDRYLLGAPAKRESNFVEDIAVGQVKSQVDPIDRGLTAGFGAAEGEAGELVAREAGAVMMALEVLHTDMKEREWNRMSEDERSEKTFSAVLDLYTQKSSRLYDLCNSCGTPGGKKIFLMEQFKQVHEENARIQQPGPGYQTITHARF